MPVRAAVLPAPHAPVELWEMDDPPMEDGSVLLETLVSEVCGTDVHLREGRLAEVPYPIIPGHVSVGRVLETRGVDRDALGAPLAVGDVVTFYDVDRICGRCYHCTVVGQPNRCPHRRVYGITYSARDGLLGGWSEQIYLRPGVRVLRLPQGLAPDDVIGGGCGLFTAFAAVERSALDMGDVVLVQGAGAVGLSCAAFASLRGASRVILIGAPADRLALARTLGADAVLDVSETTREERADEVRELTGGRGPDVVLEATGNPAAIPEGLELVRDGGTYVVAGHYTDAGDTTLNPQRHLNRKHINLRGQWGTDFRHVVRALAVLGRHGERLPFAKIIGARYGLADTNRALDDVAAMRVTKAVIDPKR
jgi:D-arabinose 1-dehydrogenase-like Zn-dependent alcohol dehydrogenase